MVGHTGEHCRQLQYLPCMGTEGTVTAFRYIITILQKYKNTPLPPPSCQDRERRHASANQNVAGNVKTQAAVIRKRFRGVHADCVNTTLRRCYNA